MATKLNTYRVTTTKGQQMVSADEAAIVKDTGGEFVVFHVKGKAVALFATKTFIGFVRTDVNISSIMRKNAGKEAE